MNPNDTTRMYNVVIRNDHTGEEENMNASPMTHAEAVTFRSKLIPDAERPKHLRTLLVEVFPPSVAERPNHLAALAHALSLPMDQARVACWILEQMTETFLLDAFARACDECAEDGTPHPYAPGPGGTYELPPARTGDEARRALQEEAEEKAGALYLAILRAPGGYDPAPALVRWAAAGNYAGDWWVGKGNHAEGDPEPAARCWGHYAVMSALWHGVCWEDDNEPLTDDRPRYEVRAPDGVNVAWRVWDRVLEETHLDDCMSRLEAYAHADTLNAGQDAEPLPAVGDLDVSADSMTWDDEYTRAAWERREAREAREDAAFHARIEAERAEAENAEARREKVNADRARARKMEE